jgi:hypothetical protein
MPLQLLKHLGRKGIEQVTSLLNSSAIDNKPPQAWRNSKVIPLYKNKGRVNDPSNYRSIAIIPPFAKLFMAVLNSRLTEIGQKLNIHAPTQAGFCAHYSTVEQALII